MKSIVTGIPIPTIPVSLGTDSPSKVLPEDLKKELTAIGLTCPDSNVDKLDGYIQDVVHEFVEGAVQSFGFFEYEGIDAASYGVCDTSCLELEDVINNLDIHGNWVPTDTPPRKSEIVAIGYPDHFDKLLATGFFSGQKSGQSYSGIGTVKALRDQFVRIADNVSATLVNKLDAAAMEAAFVNTIKAVDPSSSNYVPGWQNRSICIIENYNPAMKECDGLGVLNVQWYIKVNNYKEKKGGGGQTYDLTVVVRAVLYGSLEDVDADFRRLTAFAKDKLFFLNTFAIPVPSPIQLFDTLPVADENAFIHGIPLEQNNGDYMDVIILYKGDLQNIGCLDNTKSDCSTTYSKSVTSGFTFTAGQKISVGMKFSLDALIAKSELTVGLEISFSEQWNNSQTETLSFSVPAGKRAFLYQGYVGSSILRFSLTDYTYEYVEHAEFLSNLVVTSSTALEGIPARATLNRSPLTVGKNGKLPLWLRIGR
jgi:hypothetical protein